MAISPAELRAALWPDPGKVPTRVIACRHCRKKNRVPVSVAADPASAECGSCGKPLFLTLDEPLTGLSTTAYQHHLDRSSLESLQAVPGFPTLLRWLMTNVSDRQWEIFAGTNFVQCGPEQFPGLLALLDRAAASLDVPVRPTLYVGQSPQLNAFTVGSERPIVVVNSALLDAMDDGQVLSVLGHELGHLHSEHALYRLMATLFLPTGRVLGGAAALISVSLRLALMKWYRCAELTCDRAGLLAARDLGASLAVRITLAGGPLPRETSRGSMNLAAYVKQVRESAQRQEQSMWDGLLGSWAELGRSHPSGAWRLLHLLEWVETGNYLDILAGDYERKGVAAKSA